MVKKALRIPRPGRFSAIPMSAVFPCRRCRFDIKTSLYLDMKPKRKTSPAPSLPSSGHPSLLAALRAAAEPTRLRLLALLAGGEMAVGEIAKVLNQSQPRISRHLRLLAEGGLVERAPEGAWVFHRLAREGVGAELIRWLAANAPLDRSPFADDRARLAAVRRERAKAAQSYFRANAKNWDSLRRLHADDAQVERTLVRLLAGPDGR
ncbi:MAG: helix-turn-helix transcriptional regulator, partial [Alphaproteobacteria bacterium]|nr:helix-turn-helix transcriptional regulator [Alphaproteobacteria bacterium]